MGNSKTMAADIHRLLVKIGKNRDPSTYQFSALTANGPGLWNFGFFSVSNGPPEDTVKGREGIGASGGQVDLNPWPSLDSLLMYDSAWLPGRTPSIAEREGHSWGGKRAGATMGSANGRNGRPGYRGKVTSWLSKVFELNRAGLNWPRAVLFLDVALVPLVVFWAIGHEEYLLSALFGALFAGLADPGGGFGQRAAHIAIFALAGAGLTALGFGIGGDSWGWLVLAAFAVTLAAGLAVTLGVHRFVAALLLNIWFIVTLGVAFSFHHHAHITSYTWAQVLAWAGGAALWIAATFIAWLIRGREDRPQPVAELPGDTSRRKLTRPLIMFAVIRALAIAGTAALAFGLDLSHGYWMPIAAIVAMKPSLEQATLIALQRLAGALIGAAAAALLLLIPANEHGLRLFAITLGLEVVALVLFTHGAAIRFWNYALYAGAIAAGVLTLIDLPQPSNYSAEGYRVLWTLCGVGIGALVMLLAGLLGKRTAKASPQQAPQPA